MHVRVAHLDSGCIACAGVTALSMKLDGQEFQRRLLCSLLTESTHVALVSAIAMMLLSTHFYASIDVVGNMSRTA